MRSFEQLQLLFTVRQSIAFGAGNAGFRPYQGAAAIPADNQFLWDALNGLPGTSPILSFESPSFFDAYAALIDSLIPGTNPLDPIAAAQRNLADWGDKPPAWDQSYKSMADRLKVSPSTGFSFDAPAAADAGYWGLWNGSDPSPGASAKFADGAVDASVQLKHLLLYQPQPSDWYTASATAIAYQRTSGPPWDPASPITWNSTFGRGGTLSTVLGALVCVSDIAVDYSDDAAFTTAEQGEIEAGAASGLWPYYLAGGDANTKVSFGAGNAMSATITSGKNKPILIGGIVYSAAAYFGNQ